MFSGSIILLMASTGRPSVSGSIILLMANTGRPSVFREYNITDG